MILLFCEEFVFSDHEYMSAFSSLFFSIITLFGLLVSNYNNASWKWLLGLMFCVGWGSFALHWQKNDFNGMLDVVPMLLVIWLATYLVFRVIIFRLFAKCPTFREKVDDLIGAVLCATLCILSISMYYNAHYDLPFLFGGPSIIMSAMVLSYATFMYVTERQNIPHPIIFRYIFVGQTGILLAALLWIFTENRCDIDKNEIDPGWIKYIFAHTWWHIFLAFGTYYEVFFMQYCEIYDTRFDLEEGYGFMPTLKTSTNCLLQFGLYILPITELGQRCTQPAPASIEINVVK